jgi:predicted Rossmann fold flavoprotein
MKTVIVGGGPAGLMAAIAASVTGNEVTLYEQLSSPGKKLLATGGGKCNITNLLPQMEFIGKFGRQGRFMLPALTAFGREKLCEFFAEHNLPTIANDGFHIFPTSNNATDVLKVLLNECDKLGVTFKPATKITKLIIADNRITGIETDNEKITADQVIIATGGKGYPKLGGSGSGYVLAKQAGHKIIETHPSMVGLKTAEQWPGDCAGISFNEATATIDLPKSRNNSTSGELIFTQKGISGPAVIDLAGEISLLLKKHRSVPLNINIFPNNSIDWHTEFDKWQTSKKNLKNILANYLPNAVAEIICLISGDIAAKTIHNLKAIEKTALLANMTKLQLNIIGTEGWDKAMVTKGGVALKKVNPDTLESRLITGLYFAGEILDLNGPCGGYNLQWAFSSGYLAGLSAGQEETGIEEDGETELGKQG